MSQSLNFKYHINTDAEIAVKRFWKIIKWHRSKTGLIIIFNGTYCKVPQEINEQVNLLFSAVHARRI